MGACCYVNSSLQYGIGETGSKTIRQGSGVLSLCWVCVEDIIYVAVYASSNLGLNVIKDSLQHIITRPGEKIIAVDFNTDTMASNRTAQAFLDYFADHNRYPTLPSNTPTTFSST
ncbi:hypothetical protein [Absidia glauca]|uniref:Uncharacterized protein n=1 Tax=Absidia glauca TaxID=4829 RepID=A0A168QF37_ABSGL|nr:hypothetical protein [Absidia glauca]